MRFLWTLFGGMTRATYGVGTYYVLSFARVERVETPEENPTRSCQLPRQPCVQLRGLPLRLQCEVSKVGAKVPPTLLPIVCTRYYPYLQVGTHCLTQPLPVAEAPFLPLLPETERAAAAESGAVP